jgi:hypothetical protein
VAVRPSLPARLTLAVMLGALLSVVAGGPSAYADELPGPPDNGNKWGHVNIVSEKGTSCTGCGERIWLSMQYGPTNETVTALVLTLTNTESGVGCNPCTVPFGPGQPNVVVTQNGGGLYQASRLADPAPGGTFANNWGIGTCTITLSVSGTKTGGCSVDSSVINSSGFPPYPIDHYAGGTPGNAVPVACFEASPPYAAVGAYASFDGSCSRNKAGTTKAWTFTDASGTAGSGLLRQAKWDAPGTYPVTLKLSIGGVAYEVTHDYCVGTKAQCAPPDGLANADEGANDCGAWWHLVCHLSWLFIPQSFGESWGELSDAVTGHWPVGPVVWVGEVFGEFRYGLSFAIANTSAPGGPTDTDFGPYVPIPGGGTVRVPIIPGGHGQGGLYDLLGDVRGVSLALSRVVMVVGTALIVYRRASSLFGGGGASE